jgi:hypothetical protein
MLAWNACMAVSLQGPCMQLHLKFTTISDGQVYLNGTCTTFYLIHVCTAFTFLYSSAPTDPGLEEPCFRWRHGSMCQFTGKLQFPHARMAACTQLQVVEISTKVWPIAAWFNVGLPGHVKRQTTRSIFIHKCMAMYVALQIHVTL